MKMGLSTFQERYLYGWAILDVEVRQHLRPRRNVIKATIPEAILG